jgi:hypothetical protein
MATEQGGDWQGIARPFQLPKAQVGLRWRVLFYLVSWLGAFAAFLFLLFPESATETTGSYLQQASDLAVSMPVMAATGLAHGLTGADWSNQFAISCMGLGLLVHSAMLLSIGRLAPFVALLVLHTLALGVAVAGILHLSNLPTGG